MFTGVAAITDRTTVAGFGTATGPVLIDNLRCFGNETRLTDCYHNGVGTHDCSHSNDVGVKCQLREFIFITYLWIYVLYNTYFYS